jgi:hypothetical protein
MLIRNKADWKGGGELKGLFLILGQISLAAAVFSTLGRLPAFQIHAEV